MEGKWESLDKEYFLEYYQQDGKTSVTFNIPHTQPDNAKYYTIKDMTFYFEDSDGNILNKVYEFEMLNFNTMNVRCEKDGKTYILYRDGK